MAALRLRPQQIRSAAGLLLLLQGLGQLLIDHTELRDEVGSRVLGLGAVRGFGLIALERRVEPVQHVLALACGFKDADVLRPKRSAAEGFVGFFEAIPQRAHTFGDGFVRIRRFLTCRLVSTCLTIARLRPSAH
jgi:hypothetical protein